MYITNILLLLINHTLYLLTTPSIIRLLKRKVRELPRACPDLPIDYSSNTLPHSFSRHSIGKLCLLVHRVGTDYDCNCNRLHILE